MPDPVTLRMATEEDVIDAVEAFSGEIDTKPADLLELFNRMLDVLGAPDEDGETVEHLH